MLKLEEIANHLKTIRAMVNKVAVDVSARNREASDDLTAVEADLKDIETEIRALARPAEAGMKLRQLLELSMNMPGKPDDDPRGGR